MIDPDLLVRHARAALIQEECRTTSWLASQNFSELELLRSTVEELVVREERVEVERIAESAGSASVQRNDFWVENHPYWWGDIIAPQFRGAFFLTLMSAAELHLGRAAENLGQITGEPPPVLTRDFYKSVRRYLHTVIGRDPLEDKHWQRIMAYSALRNALAHRGGWVADKGLQKVQRLSVEVPGLTLSGQLAELGSDFCITALADCQNVVDTVLRELTNVCRNMKATNIAS